ncbi:Calx-beta domain-containing protein [Aliidiomarina maris]|uniref:Calx-beta domain-containing protein n=1 Tax=Aliidiomarina maris TaxID=531312 RepID=A0A327WQ51_9GAMM|nr:Calx-beta domain-containing protein [Aliidiomarina maris]RAJ92962.1 Calx-beta domain-containing protein [Aliidiomarina maris]RUO18452.1 hypothetical protein CWE07_13950 [Aliidiomarina maris]
MLNINRALLGSVALAALIHLTGCLGDHPDDLPGAVNNPNPELSLADSSVAVFDPADSQMTYSVRVAFSRAAPQAGSVTYRTVSGSALPDRDYQQVESTVNFATGDRSVSLPVELINDSGRSSEREFSVELTRASNASLSEQVSQQVVITSSDVASERPSLTIPSQLSWTAPTSGTVNFSVVMPLSEPVASEASIEIRTIDGSARQGIHFDSITGEQCNDGICTIGAGRTELEFLVPLRGQLGGDPRQFTLQFLNARGIQLPANREVEATLNYANDGDVPSLNVPSSLTLRMPTVERSPLSYPVVLTFSAPLSEPATLALRTVDNTAFAGTHYVELQAIGDDAIEIAAGTREVELAIELLHDTSLAEGLNFELQLVSSTGIALGEQRSIEINIANSNLTAGSAPTLTLPSDLVYHEPQETRDYMMLAPLSESMPADGSVHVTLVEQTARDGIDFNAYSETIELPRFATELQIPLTLLNNPAPTDAQTFRVELSQANGVNLPSDRSFEVTIEDAARPAPFPRLQLTPDLIRVAPPQGNAGEQTITLYFDLSDNLAADGSVFVRTRAGTANPDVDYRTIGETISVAAGDFLLAVEVDLLNNGTEETREFELVFSNPQGLSLPESRSVTVQLAPVGVQSLPSVNVPEVAVTVFVPSRPDATERMIVLPFSDFAPLRGVLTVASQDRTAEEGVDYTFSDTEFEFLTGAREVIIRFDVATTATASSFEILLLNATNASLPSAAEARVINVNIVP